MQIYSSLLLLSATSTASAASSAYEAIDTLYGSNTKHGCDSVFVDLGAYDGNTLEAWYMHPDFYDWRRMEKTKALARTLKGQWSDIGKRVKELHHLNSLYGKERMPGVRERQKFCSIAFEGSPLFNPYLASLKRELYKRGYISHLYNATAVAVGHHNPVTFYIGTGADAFSTRGGLTDGLNNVHAKTPVSVRSVDIIDLIRDLNEHAKRIIIKIDVELYETQILRGLITSGALCAGKVSDVLVEWDKIEIPARWWEFAAKRKAAAEQRRVDDEKRSIMWMLNSSACEHVHVGLWY